MKKTDLGKLYYSIREVSQLAGVQPHVLRFWEKEFSMLRPKRGRSGNRSYRERDVKVVLAIHDLLYNQKYTIKGAVERLKSDRSLWEERALTRPSSTTRRGARSDALTDLRQMLLDLKNLINDDK